MRKKSNKKIIPFIRGNEKAGIEIEDKMPLAKCRELLNCKGMKYADEEILLIRDWFYCIAEITYDEYFLNQNQCIIIPLTQNQNCDHEESDYLRAG
jgi:hypothetical protein